MQYVVKGFLLPGPPTKVTFPTGKWVSYICSWTYFKHVRTALKFTLFFPYSSYNDITLYILHFLLIQPEGYDTEQGRKDQLLAIDLFSDSLTTLHVLPICQAWFHLLLEQNNMEK